jgi:hypothetical protein
MVGSCSAWPWSQPSWASCRGRPLLPGLNYLHLFCLQVGRFLEISSQASLC